MFPAYLSCLCEEQAETEGQSDYKYFGWCRNISKMYSQYLSRKLPYLVVQE